MIRYGGPSSGGWLVVGIVAGCASAGPSGSPAPSPSHSVVAATGARARADAWQAKAFEGAKVDVTRSQRGPFLVVVATNEESTKTKRAFVATDAGGVEVTDGWVTDLL